MTFVKKIISGGQTGVDQAALQIAIDMGIEHGGWCPPGRVCESGIIDKKFQLKETPVERSEKAPDIPRSLRTEWNVRDSDGTLILSNCELKKDPGTQWTIKAATLYGKLLMTINPLDFKQIENVQSWLSTNKIKILNIAGPSENACLGIGMAVARFLKRVLTEKNSKI